MPTTVSLISIWLEKALKELRSLMVVLWSVTLMTLPAVGEKIILMDSKAEESGTILMGLLFHLLVMVVGSTEQEVTWLSD